MNSFNTASQASDIIPCTTIRESYKEDVLEMGYLKGT